MVCTPLSPWTGSPPVDVQHYVDAAEGRVTKAAFVRAAHRRISCAIVRGNARMYSIVADQLVRASGHACVPGMNWRWGRIVIEWRHYVLLLCACGEGLVCCVLVVRRISPCLH